MSALSTEEQLARKRPRDRRSQHAMRDRAELDHPQLARTVSQLTKILATERNETVELKEKLQLVEDERDHLRSETASLQLQILRVLPRVLFTLAESSSLGGAVDGGSPLSTSSSSSFRLGRVRMCGNEVANRAVMSAVQKVHSCYRQKIFEEEEDKQT